jgi:serine/threonine protein kinase
MNDPLDNMKTMQRDPTYDTIGDMLTQRPDEAIVLAGRYRIVRKLGEGGMGSVWLAADTKLDGRQVAIKMLPVVLVANKRAIQQLKAEAKVAIQLAHPSIATLRAFEESAEGPFLVMDYIRGETLEDILTDRGALQEEEVFRLFTPIAQAIDYAHTQRVIHRDIKPSNILIREDGMPFITDFGIAREMKDTMTRVTGRGTSGTLPYMSPEQLRGDPPTPQQDIYSFAATIYEALAGHPPFYRGQIEYQIMHEPAAPITYGRSGVKRIVPGLEKQPELRPSTCAGVLQRENTPIATQSRTSSVALPVVHISDARPLSQSPTARKENHKMQPQQETNADKPADKPTALDIILAFVPMIGPVVGLIGIYHLIRGRPKRGGTMVGCACLGWVIGRLIVMHMTGDTNFWP